MENSRALFAEIGHFGNKLRLEYLMAKIKEKKRKSHTKIYFLSLRRIKPFRPSIGRIKVTSMVISAERFSEVNIAFLGNEILATISVLRLHVRVDKGILLQATFDGNKSPSEVRLCCASKPRR